MRTLAESIKPFYALVRRGGSEPGCKPRTKLAFIELAMTPDDGVPYNMGRIISMNGNVTKSLRKIYSDEILKTWDYRPERLDIISAKKSLQNVAYPDENLNR